MKLSGKTVGFIIALIVLSLIGLTMLQVSLFDSAMQLKEATFKNNVTSILQNVADQIEMEQVYISAFQTICDTSHMLDIIAHIPFDSTSDSVNHKVVVIAIDSTTQGHVSFGDTGLGIENKLYNETLCIDDQSIVREYHFDSLGNSMVYFNEANDTSQILMNIKMAVNSGRTRFVNNVIDRMWLLDSTPVENRLDSAMLDSLIAEKLADNNIDLEYIYGVKIDDVGAVLFCNSDLHNDDLFKSEFKTRLFPFDVLGPQVNLYLYFPDTNVFLWSEMTPLLLLMIGFMAIIIFCFAYTIRKIIHQKRNASFLISFINNMTHEFKTPISTVALATEAIMRSDQIGETEKVERYAKMIKDENLRMRNQAEKILQMAALEEGDFELKISEIDIHQIIKQAVENISLHIETRQGEIKSNLTADSHTIKADPEHLNSIIYNLLDNANKYSSDKPKIEISTNNFGNGIVIKVKDHGIGIGENDLKMITKKYYRVASGNIHDVKGFGLGLSYVKLLVEAHQGSIKISSKYGEGTTVELFLPIDLA